MLEVYGLACQCDKCDPEEIRYVGKTTKGHEARLRTHKAESRRSDSMLAKSHWIRKHGEDNIVSKVICVAESEGELAELEILWIEKLKTHGTKRGLNLTAGGEGITGYTHTTQARALFRERTRKQFAKKHPRKMLEDSKALEIRRRLWNGEYPEDVSKDFPEVSLATVRKMEQPHYRSYIPFPETPRVERDPQIAKRARRTKSRYAPGELKKLVQELYREGDLSKTEIALELGVSNATVTKYTRSAVE